MVLKKVKKIEYKLKHYIVFALENVQFFSVYTYVYCYTYKIASKLIIRKPVY